MPRVARHLLWSPCGCACRHGTGKPHQARLSMTTGYGYQALAALQQEFFARLALRHDGRQVALDRYVPKETGSAFPVARGQILHITCCDGAQVCDFNAFAANDPTEHFWSGRTRTLQG